MKGEVSIVVDASPDRVWELVSDVTRMGEWSPVCYRCEWTSGEPGKGSRFRGYNKQGLARWWTECEVTDYEPRKVFAFTTVDGLLSVGYRGREMTRWRYELEPSGAATRVTESFELVSFPYLLRPLSPILRRQDRESGMRTTLQRLKKVAEGSGPND